MAGPWGKSTVGTGVGTANHLPPGALLVLMTLRYGWRDTDGDTGGYAPTCQELPQIAARSRLIGIAIDRYARSRTGAFLVWRTEAASLRGRSPAATGAVVGGRHKKPVRKRGNSCRNTPQQARNKAGCG